MTHADAQRLLDNPTDMLFIGDANFVGELLRSFSYPDDDDIGGYTNRDVRHDAETLTGAAADELVDTFFDYDYDADDPDEVSYHHTAMASLHQIAYVHRFTIGKVAVILVNYWDGDPTLLFFLTDGQQQRVVLNTDCKKSDRWFDDSLPDVHNDDLAAL